MPNKVEYGWQYMPDIARYNKIRRRVKMKKPKVKMLLKLTAAVLSVVMMLCALPLGALASEIRTAPTSLENGVTVEKPQSQKV